MFIFKYKKIPNSANINGSCYSNLPHIILEFAGHINILTEYIPRFADEQTMRSQKVKKNEFVSVRRPSTR